MSGLRYHPACPAVRHSERNGESLPVNTAAYAPVPRKKIKPPERSGGLIVQARSRGAALPVYYFLTAGVGVGAGGLGVGLGAAVMLMGAVATVPFSPTARTV